MLALEITCLSVTEGFPNVSHTFRVRHFKVVEPITALVSIPCGHRTYLMNDNNFISVHFPCTVCGLP